MRKPLILALLLFCSSSTFADDRWRISVLAAEISNEERSFAGHTIGGNDPHAGIAVGVAYAPTPQWDAELTIASQTHTSPYTRLFHAPTPNGPGLVYPATEFREYRVNPVDFSVTRHFRAGQAIAPYVRAGVRYVGAPDDPPVTNTIIIPWNGSTSTDPLPVPYYEIQGGFGLDDRLSAQAGAGVRVRLTPRTAFRAEATRLLRNEKADFDPLLRYAVGLSWVF